MKRFLSSYLAALDMCLQGIVSPATLGIDVGKRSAQRHSGKKRTSQAIRAIR